MHDVGALLKDQIFHARKGRFLARLGKQDHQDNPLELLFVDCL